MSALLSPAHPLVKKWARLATGPGKRKEEGAFLAEGPHLVEECLSSGLKILEAAATPEFLGTDLGSKLLVLLRSRKTPLHLVSSKVMAKISGTETPQGVFAASAFPLEPSFEAWLKAPGGLIVAAENLQVPGNLGTLLRSAWAVGAAGVLVTESGSDPWSPKALRAGSGAQFHVPFLRVPSLAARLKELPAAGWKAVATEASASKSYLEEDWRPAVCLAIGSEGQGLSPEARKACGASVAIRYPGSAESLNAAISASILMFEILRQRKSL